MLGMSPKSTHNGIRSLWQNTIDYNNAPSIDSIPDQVILQDHKREPLIDLWSYTSDTESSDYDLEYSITYQSNPGDCMLYLQDHLINITSRSGWTGNCWIVFQVTDSIAISNGNIYIDIVPITDKIFLPLLLKQ
jgi:hypothetical protein